MPERPLVKRHLLVATVDGTDVFVLSEDQAWAWQSRGLALLLPRLDGTRTVGELFDMVEGELMAPEVVFLLNELRGIGLLAEGGISAETGPTSDVAFWHALGVDDERSVAHLDRSVRVRAAAPGVEDDVLLDALAEAGVGCGERGNGTGADLEVVVTDHYFRPELARMNDIALSSGSPWMACKLVGHTMWIGPIFRPGRTGCLACLQHRLRLNRQVEDYVVRTTGDTDHYATSVVRLPVATGAGATWAAQEIVFWLAGGTERLEGKLLTVGLGRQGLEVATHELIRRPQCPACGEHAPAATAAPRITLAHAPAAVSTDGGHRVEDPEETLGRLERHVSPITGVVTWVADGDDDPEGLVYSSTAGHSFSLGPETVQWLQRSLRTHTGGKGTTPAQARVSAVAEAIERYCGIFSDDVPRLRSTYTALGDQAVHPHRCLNYSDWQYDHRDELNADDRQGYFHHVPRRLPEDLEIDWAPLWSLSREETRYLPAAFCYYGHPDVGRHFYCSGDANGCAAGTALEEAILHAFLELVERDSAAIWWYNQLRRPVLDLDSFPDPYIPRLRERYERHGRTVAALDITTDLGIPAIAAVSRRIDGPTDDLLFGLGAHLDPSIALRRALTELNQFLPAVSGRTADGRTSFAWPDDVAVRFWTEETLDTQPQLAPDPAVPPRRLSDFTNRAHPDLYDSLQACLEVTDRLGSEFMVLDQSRPDIDLHVVRVVVPGLRHFWRRLGPGRLYDVPVQMGWLSAPKPERDLNPVSIFF